MVPLLKKINFKCRAVVIVALLCSPVFLYALPEGESVIEGTATFDRSQANVLKINTSSDKLIVEYNSFSIAGNESVYFTQPSVSSAALNRIVGSGASDISGLLNANGIIYLINPHGINIGPNANINAASFIASSLNISNADFLSGRNNFFKAGGNAFILNRGNIIIRNGGYVCLLSQAVENRGTILANLGTVVMASGEKMTLALDDLNQISVVIDEGVKEAVFGPDGKRIDSAVKNSGTITANGGKVLLTAKVLNKVFDYAVNNTGVVEAKSLVNKNGVIELKGEGAAIVNSGTLNAGTVKVDAVNTEFINKGKIISEAQENIANSGTITIQVNSLLQGGSIIADKLISVTADKIDVFIKDNPLAVEVDPLLNTSPAVIIQAPEVKVIARQFGSSDVPLNINAPLTYIYRTNGDINILDSLGIGTSILLRGPPDGFGAIVYNKDSSLTLEAQEGSIFETQGVTISATNLTLTANQNINIQGALKGSSIILNSINGNTILDAGSLIDASGDVGGLVEILGKQVELFSTQINASGTNGGGTVLIGGDFQGKGTVVNATNVYVSRDSYINADAISQGDGGKVIVWSDESTYYYGHISARGGSELGNGGFVQVSSAGYLEFNGFVNALAPVGARGIFIIDPSGTSGYAASLATDLLDYKPGETVTIMGSGWQPGEAVSLILHPSKDTLSDTTLTAVADANGNFSNSSFTPQEYDRGVEFVLTGRGQSSGLVAQTRFTDATITSTVTGGAWATGGTWVGGVAPVATDDVVIVGPVTVDAAINQTGSVTINSGGTLTATAVNVTVGALTINSGGTLTTSRILTVSGATNITGTINFNTTARANVFTGDVTLNSGAVWNEAVAITPTFSGNFTNNATTFTASTGAHTFNGATKTLSGTTATSIPSVTVTGTYTNNGTLTVSTALAGAGTLTQGTDATLNIGDVAIAPTLVATANGNTVNWNKASGTGAQTIKATTGYYNLTTSGSGIKSSGAATTVAGTLTIGSGTTLDITTGNDAWSVGGDWTNNGAFTARLGTVTLNGAGAQVIGGSATTTFNNLTLSGSGAKTTTGATVNGILSMEGTATTTGTAPTYGAAATLQYKGSVAQTTGNEFTTPWTGTGGVIINNASGVGLGAVKTINTTLTLTAGTFTITPGLTMATGATISRADGSLSVAPTFGTTVNVTYTTSTAGVTTGPEIPTSTSVLNNLTINDSGQTVTLGTAVTVNGDFTITAGTFDVSGSNYALTVKGAWTNGGTFMARSGTVTLGGADQTVSGVNTTFYNLTTSGSGAKTLSGVNATINNNFAIGSGTTFTVGANTISVAGATTVDGTLNINNTTGTKTFTGDVTINSGGTWSETANEAVSFGGSLQNDGIFTAGTAAHTFSGSGKTFSGTSEISIPSVTLSGTYTNNGILTVSTALTSSGTLTQGTNATLNIGDGTVGPTLVASANNGNTVNYNLAGIQTVKPTTYNNLTLSGSGAKTTTSVIVNGILSMEGTATTTVAPTYGGSAILQYKGTGTQTTGAELPIAGVPNLTINNGDGVNLNNSTIISGTLTLTSGTFSVGANTITLNGPTITVTSGNLTTTSSSNLSFGGSSSSVNIPSSVIALNDLTINNANGITLNSDLTISGTLTLTNGAFSIGAHTLTMGNGATISRANGSLSATPTFAGTVNVTYTGATSGVTTANELPTSTGNVLNNLTINDSGQTVTLGSAVTVNGNLTVTAGTFGLGAHTTNRATSGGTLTVSNGAVLRIGGTGTLPSDYSTHSIGATSTIEYYGTAQIIANLNSAQTYGNLILSGSGAKTLQTGTGTISGNLTLSGSVTTATVGDLTISGNLDVGSGTTFTVADFNITVTGTTSVSGTLTHSSATGTKTYTGNVTINNGGTWNDNADAIAISFGGNLQNDGIFNAGTGLHTFTGATKTFSGNNPISIPNLTINGTTTNNGTLTVSTALAGSSTLTNGTNATLNIGGTLGITGLTATANGNTVNYTGAGQTLKVVSYYNLTLSGGAETFGAITTIGGNLTLSGSASATTAANLTISGNLDVGSGTTFTVANYNITVTGTTSVSGTLAHSSATGATKRYIGLVTIASGGKWNNSGDASINFRGGLTNNGTFTSGAGTYTFDTANQNIGGTNAISIVNLTVTGATIILTNNGTLTVTTALSGTGGLTQGTNATLNIGGTSGITTLTATANPNTVNYNGDTQTIKATTYHNLTLSGNGTKTISSNVTVNNGTLTVNSGAVLAPSAAVVIDGTGTLTGNGTVQVTRILPTADFSSQYTINSKTLTDLTVEYAGAGAQTVSALTYGNLKINVSGQTATLAGPIRINGTITVSAGTLDPATYTITGSGTNTLNVTGTIKADKTNFTDTYISFGTINLNSGSTVEYDGTNQTIDNTLSYVNLKVSGTGASVSGTANVSGTLTITGVTLTNNGTLTVSTALAGTGGELTNSATGTLNINFGGTVGITTLTASVAGNTVNYGYAGAQTVKATTYHHLTLSGSGAKTLTSVSTINGNLTLTGAATATTAAGLTIGGNLDVGSGTTFTVPSTYTLGVTGTTSVAGTLTHSGTGARTFTGNVTINSGGIWNETGIAAYSFAGNLQNEGSFTADTGVHTFSGAGKTISGTISIPKVTIDGTITNNGTLTVSTVLAGAGTLTNGATGTLNIGATAVNLTLTILTATASGNTVNYTSDSAQAIKTPTDNTYYNLILSGVTSAKSAAAGLTIEGDFTLSGSATFTTGAFTHTFKGNWTIDTSAGTPITATGSTINFNTPATPAATSISGSSSATLGFNNVNINNTKGFTFNKNVTVSGTLTVTGTTLTNNGTLTVTTALTGTGGLTQGTNAVLNIGGTSDITTLTATASGNTVNYNGTSAQTIKTPTGTPATYVILKINNSAGATLGGAVTVTTLTIGDVTASSIFNDGGYQVTSSGTLNLNLGTFKLGSAGTATAFPAFGIINISSGTTVEYTAGVAQTVSNAPVYQNLTISGSGTKTLAGATTVNGTLTVSAGTLDPATFTITGSGVNTLSITGTILVDASTFAGNYASFGTRTLNSGSTVNYKGTTQTVDNTLTYANLTISGSGTKTLGGNTTVNGDLTVNSETTLATSTNTLIVKGNLTVNGSITGSGAITLNGAAMNIDGTGSIDNPVTIISAKTIPSGANLTFNGAVTMSGGLTDVTNNDTVTFNSTLNGTTNPTWTNAANSTLNYGEATLFATSGTLTATALGNTVNYNGTSSQTIKATTYNLLKINNAAGATLGGAATVTTLTIGDVTSSSVFNDGGFQVTSTGTLNLTSGTFKLGSAGTATVFPAFATRNISAGTTIEYAAGVAQTVSIAPAYQDLTFSGAGTKTTANGTLSIAGDWSVGSTTVLNTNNTGVNLTGNLTSNGAITQGTGAINIGGNWTHTGTYTPGASGVVNYNGSSVQTARGMIYTTLKINNAAGATLGGAATVTTLTIGDVTSSSVFNDGGFQVTSTGTLNLTSGTFKLGSAGTATVFPAFATRNISAGTTIEYAAGVAQTVSIAPAYQDLTFSGAGTKTTANGTLSIAGDWSVGSTTVLNTNNTGVNLTGNLTGSGNITQGTGAITVGGDWTNTGTFSASSAGVTLTGASKQITGNAGGITFSTLTVDGTYTNKNTSGLTVSTVLSGAGTLTQGTNAVLNIGGTSGITILTATANPNTVNYNGAAQTVKAVTYYNLILSGSGTKTLPAAFTATSFTATTASTTIIFKAGANYAITNLTVDGQAAGTRITLASDMDGTRFNLTNLSGTVSVANVDVKDSNASSLITPTGSNKDSGNNINWYLVDHFTISGTASQTAGTSNQLTITAVDGSGGTSASFAGDKVLVFSGANSIGSFTPTVTDKTGSAINFGSNTTITFTNGVSTSGGSMVLYKAESASISATQGSVNTPTPLSVNVTPASAYKLLFGQQPSNVAFGTVISPAVTVHVADQFSNTVTSDNSTNITIAIGIDASSGIATLFGTPIKTASGGIATFNNLSISFPGNGYTLSVASTGLTSAASNTFNITGNILRPATSAFANSQVSTSDILRILLPNTTQLNLYQVNTFIPTGPVYLYHPLTPSNISAFEGIEGRRAVPQAE